MLTKKMKKPSLVIIRIGSTLKEVIPCTANRTIALTGYLLFPAARSPRS